MSDDITDQAERVLRLRWEQPGPDYSEPVPTGLVWLGDWASEHLGELVAELKTTRQFRYQVADALGFVECVEGVGNAIIADDVTILDYVRAQAETARKHETECPVWCDDHEHFEHALSCKECGGSGCGPGTATGAHEGCDECGGDGRDHDFAYVHAPDVEAELKTTRAQLETLRAGMTRVEHFARTQALSDRVRTGPAYSTYHCEERYWLDLLALIERAEVADV